MSKKALRAYQQGGRSSNEALRATRVDRCLILGAYDRSNQGSRERDAISFKWLGYLRVRHPVGSSFRDRVGKTSLASVTSGLGDFDIWRGLALTSDET